MIYDIYVYIHIHNTWCHGVVTYYRIIHYSNSQESLSSSVFFLPGQWSGMDTIDKATWFKWYPSSFDFCGEFWKNCVNLGVDVYVL